MTTRPQINVRLSKELHSAVKESAKTQGISLNQFVVNVLSEAVSTVSVPLKAVGGVKGAKYIINIPPEMYFASPVICGQQDIYNNVHLCTYCQQEGTSTTGCGKPLT